MALLLVAGAALAGAQAPVRQSAAPTEFTVFLRGAQVGTLEVFVDRTSEGIVISGTARLGQPLLLTVRSAEIRYDPDWKPLAFAVDAFDRNQALFVQTTFAGGKAASQFSQAGKSGSKTDDVSPDTVVLSNVFFGAYEALAARLVSAKPGTVLRVYIAPQAEIPARVVFVSDERIQVPGGSVTTRHFQLAFENPKSPIQVDLWNDAAGRMVRFSVPDQGLDVVRTDVATVAARRETVPRAGDESVMIPANGFNIGATVSRPAGMPSARLVKLPAVVLVSGSEPVDRDEVVWNVPIFAQVAGALADAGFIVVRYDKRGVGQSGGRIESVTISDYADDAVAVTKFVEKRKDIDNKRIALVGYGEGGWIALVAATRDSQVAALALVATPGTTGDELMLERQRRALEKLDLPDAERRDKIALQQKIHKAVETGSGWEGIPANLRRQSDTPWFQSFLLFDPAKVVAKVRRPILILQAGLDSEVSREQFRRLSAAAKARKARQGQTTEATVIDGIDHLLVPAKTGDADEYVTLTDRNVSPMLPAALAAWLKTILPGAVKK